MPRQLGPKGRSDLRTSLPHRNHAKTVAPASNRLFAPFNNAVNGEIVTPRPA